MTEEIQLPTVEQQNEPVTNENRVITVMQRSPALVPTIAEIAEAMEQRCSLAVGEEITVIRKSLFGDNWPDTSTRS